MKMKHLAGLILVGTCFSTIAIASENEPSNEEIVAQIMAGNDKPNAAPDGQEVAKNPASGFWQCNGTRLHMGVDMASWTNLDNGEMFTLYEKPSATEDGKGTNYAFASTRNTAYMEFFVVSNDKKKLGLRDLIKFNKIYPCKREK